MDVTASAPVRSSYQLRYSARSAGGRALSFPCDAHGRVDIDSLSDAARNDYFYARTVVGRDFTRPSVQATH
jgi:hypothetical protein